MLDPKESVTKNREDVKSAAGDFFYLIVNSDYCLPVL